MLRFEPVAGFDRLLNLDGGLGQLDAIEKVTLADFAGEVAVFRLRLNRPLDSDSLVAASKA